MDLTRTFYVAAAWLFLSVVVAVGFAFVAGRLSRAPRIRELEALAEFWEKETIAANTDVGRLLDELDGSVEKQRDLINLLARQRDQLKDRNANILASLTVQQLAERAEQAKQDEATLAAYEAEFIFDGEA